MSKLKTPSQWMVDLKVDATILNYDGWRDGTSWEEPITKDDFQERFAMCTIRAGIKGHTIRDKKDRDFEESPAGEKSPAVEESPDLDDKAGCPTCGNEDIQSAELLEAWKEIEELKAAFQREIQGRSGTPSPIGISTPVDPNLPSEVIDWKERYEKIKAGYVKTRLEVSGSFGNWDYATRKRVLEHEISTELGFVV